MKFRRKKTFLEFELNKLDSIVFDKIYYENIFYNIFFYIIVKFEFELELNKINVLYWDRLDKSSNWFENSIDSINKLLELVGEKFQNWNRIIINVIVFITIIGKYQFFGEYFYMFV